MIYANTLVVWALERFGEFCVLQSRTHEVWARFFASSMKDDLRYTPDDCFRTFPLPFDWESASALEDAGRGYYDFRAALMVRSNEGLTKIYNRFHDRDEPSSDIARLRELHAAMDRVVLNAYGWTNIDNACDFFEVEADDDQEPASTGRRRKRKFRYRWPDAVHDEVLARLLALNAERAAAERLSGAASMAAKRKPARRKASLPSPPASQAALFEDS